MPTYTLFRTSPIRTVTRGYPHAHRSKCPECNNLPPHGTLPRNLPLRRSRIRQVISAITLFHFGDPCRPAHNQILLVPMPPLSRRKCRANDGAIIPMPISIHRYVISVRLLRSRCVWTILYCQWKTD